MKGYECSTIVTNNERSMEKGIAIHTPHDDVNFDQIISTFT